MKVDEALLAISSQSEDTYKNNQVLSFFDYIEIFKANPNPHLRFSYEYLREAIAFCKNCFEQNEVLNQSYEKFDFFKSLNLDVLSEINKALNQFDTYGASDKLIVLYGPNSSGKSYVFNCLAKCLEIYSQAPQGALYKFNWIFPNVKIIEDSEVEKNIKIGFSDTSLSKPKTHDSYAYLSQNDIAIALTDELKDNPLFLIPHDKRDDFINKIIPETSSSDILSKFKKGNLSPKNKKIFDCLLNSYTGNLIKVLKHVQIQKLCFTLRYKSGISSIKPEISVDAKEKIVAIENNLQFIPHYLNNIRLYELSGELIEGNRGIIEYSDLLKRPLDAFKYLISLLDNNSIDLECGTVDIDSVFLGTVIDKQLDAFKKIPDWQTFKERFYLINVPYFLDFRKEVNLYKTEIEKISQLKTVIKESISIVSQWAILSRLRQPDTDLYDENLKAIITKITPFDKLKLYCDETPPNLDFQSLEEIKKLKILLLNEGRSHNSYEGKFGCSPREVKFIINSAAQNHDFDCLHPISIFIEIENIIQEKSNFDFLQIEPRETYHDCALFLEKLKKDYSDTFLRDLYFSMGIFNYDAIILSFEKYVHECMNYVRSVNSNVNIKYDNSKLEMLNQFEENFNISDDKEIFRQNIVSKLANWKINNPKELINLSHIYSFEISNLERNLFKKNKVFIDKIIENMIDYTNKDLSKMDKYDLNICENAFQTLEKTKGYSTKSVVQALFFCIGLSSPSIEAH